MNRYELRQYDTPLLSFRFMSGELGGFSVADLNILSKHSELFPLDMEQSEASLLSWLEKRVIPKNRAFVEEILKTFGLLMNDTKGIIDICKGLSLNDSYWVVPEGFDGSFAQYNLYENRFSEALALVAYTGIGASDAAFSTSPELTTNGMLPKAWRYVGSDGIYLYKGGTSGAANTGNEPYSEYYASQIAEAMELNAVRYDLESWKGILASKCKLFTDIDTAYIPIGRIVKSGGLDAVVKYYDSLGQSFSDNIRDMLVFDALIYNTDRHFGNFGLLRDNKSGNITAPAPIFDNGMSLFNFAMPDEIANLDEYAKTRPPAYGGIDFEGIVRTVITPRQVEKLRKLIRFTFTRHSHYNLSENRLAAIERHLQKRVGQLIDLSKVRQKKSLHDKLENNKKKAENSTPSTTRSKPKNMEL